MSPGFQNIAGLNDRRNRGEGVFENCVDIRFRKAGHRVTWNDDLIGPIDRVESEVLDGHVHRDADPDESSNAEISKNGIECGAVERGEAMKPGKNDVAFIDRNLGHDLCGFASAEKWVLDPLHVLKETRVGIRPAPVVSALCDAVDDRHASLAPDVGQFRDGLNHSALRTFCEGR